MIKNSEILDILRHDMHKVRIAGAPMHKDALKDPVAQQADAMAAWFSRNFLREQFEDKLVRKSLVFHAHQLKPLRTLINQHRLEASKLFEESDPFILHQKILDSKLLNLYSEARNYPYTSLKYHILLSCALYYNLKNGFELKDLYFCENLPTESPLQIIYNDPNYTWAIIPQQKEGMAKIHPRFYQTWERRRKISFGGDHQILDELLTTIGSWSVALATIEDFFSLI